MKKVGLSAAIILGFAGAACATDVLADDMVTKAVPAATAKALSQPAACGSPEDFVATSCPST
jgi:hypothetical protein